MDQKQEAKRVIHYGRHLLDNTLIFFKWLVLGTLIGIVVGLIGTSFAKILNFSNAFFASEHWLIFLLPVGGLIIAFLYKYWMREPDRGTNLVLAAVAEGQEITPKLVPLIYVATVITHMFGGSAGREGAAFQIGGGVGALFGRGMKLDKSDRHTLIMAGMSAGFASLFGTPMAAAFFSMEVISVGVMYYGALVPCVTASFTATWVAKHFGIPAVFYPIKEFPQVSIRTLGITLLLSALCAGLSGLFCFLLHFTGKIFRGRIRSPFIRIVAGSLIVIGITFAIGTFNYNGASISVIQMAMKGRAPTWAFFWKALLTAVTLGCGFKGGEIIPSIFVGATFGCTFGNLLGLDPSFTAALGMVCVFCGVTNCPVSSLIIGFEVFNYSGAVYVCMAVAVSYMLSGYYGLYDSQKIMYSKMKTSFVNRNINNKVH